MEEKPKADFYIRIDYDRETCSPDRLFYSMAELIKACQDIDKLLIKSISSTIEPLILLEDIEKGSILTAFKVLLDNVDDEGLKNLEWKKIIGNFLVKGKYHLIDFMNKNTKISSKKEIETLQAELLALAEESDVKQLKVYTPLKENDIIAGLESFHNALLPLAEDDKVFYSFPDLAEEKQKIINTIEFNRKFKFSTEDIKELLVKESIMNENTMILTIKKPEFLGDAKWEFRHHKKPIDARILDTEWLAKFKNREFALKPGDAIKSIVKITENYDYSNEVASVDYEVIKVIDIMLLPSWRQTNLFDD